jgi:hypothetical protein
MSAQPPEAGHEGQLPPAAPSGRFGFGQRTFAGPYDNDALAP